jgi:hypothetical protein
MDSKETHRLKVGDRVQIWAESPDACAGTVRHVSFDFVRIKWDDGDLTINRKRDPALRFYGEGEV